MKLHLTRAEGRNLFTGYGDGYVKVNDERHQGSLIVAPDRLETWQPQSFEALAPEHLRTLLDFKPEIVILGTGERLRFPAPHLSRILGEAAVGFEVMDTKAACRTYNILMAEGRQVVAAIFV